MPSVCVSCGGKKGRLVTAGRDAEIQLFGQSKRKGVKYIPFDPRTNTCSHCISKHKSS